ncbi:TetR family transcriptional regulator [Nocardioides baekrokdamisoli]|uniref:TetR family transcriptional regulator n=1 Tax=Nocardioides baekrokdamisoli TaxID=1804624 RepID=A0A3G9IZJ0_9ACTN|nr:TetR/AcrR family transcriptional regulator [Nocardioides baekrokdamisoli]BBH16604.1 TetR family transcriptional regulator [Nocardioides baekrokdamisoli]
MTSDRNSDRFLDAAREVILSVGWKRATLTDVARRAGVSRMTVYRAYPDMQSILADLMTREWTAQIAGVVATREIDEDDVPGVFARKFTAAVSALRSDELFRRIIEVDPEQLLPYLIDRRGRSQDVVIDLLAGRIETAQRLQQVRAGNPLLIARSLMLAAHGFAISASTMHGDRLTQVDFDTELTTLVRRYLAP